MSLYDKFLPKQLIDEKKYLTSSIFKLLPYKQEGYEFLDNYFESVIQKLIGFNEVVGHQAKIVTVIALVKYARKEDDFVKYRKSILDACGILNSLKVGDNDV